MDFIIMQRKTKEYAYVNKVFAFTKCDNNYNQMITNCKYAICRSLRQEKNHIQNIKYIL